MSCPELSVGVSRFGASAPAVQQPKTTAHRADRPFELLTAITSREAPDPANAVARLDQRLGIGGDTFESGAGRSTKSRPARVTSSTMRR